MKIRRFFLVLKGNIECAFCKYSQNCPMQYYPDHKIRDGLICRVCQREKEKREKKILNSKLP